MSGKRSRAFRAYQKIKNIKPSRSLFDLSHDKLMTCDMFKLYPVCCMEMSPGDTFHIANESVTRLQPLNAPILSPIYQNTHYFFVPYRILWDQWTEFITGGEDGENGGSKRLDSSASGAAGDVIENPSGVSPALPRWNPNYMSNIGPGSLWDYLGFPVNVHPAGATPVDFPRRAYNMIWNEYYRDENLQDEIPLANAEILYRSWKKDYFTSALLSQQRGVAPAMPVSGSGAVPQNVSNVAFNQATYNSDGSVLYYQSINSGYSNETNLTLVNNPIVNYSNGQKRSTSLQSLTVNNGYVFATFNVLNPQDINEVSFTIITLPTVKYETLGNVDFSSSGVGFQVKDLRQAFQIQKWLELANRGGVRYTEFLRAFFGVSPRDDRLQRPEYIGGSKSPIVISEVLQTSATANEPTPQGYLAGHGLGAERTYIGSYSAQEYGLLMGLMSYTTPPMYCCQGINRQWLRRTKYDFLFPQFTGLSEQAIIGAEIFAIDEAFDEEGVENRKVWGFNEVYDELRSMPSMVVGKMRSIFNYWHLGRLFSSKPALNSDFISGADVSKRIFAVPTEDGIICHYANIIRAVRPLPKYGTPRGV